MPKVCAGNAGRNSRTCGRGGAALRRIAVRNPAREGSAEAGGRSRGRHRLGSRAGGRSLTSADSARHRTGSRFRPRPPAGTGTFGIEMPRKFESNFIKIKEPTPCNWLIKLLGYLRQIRGSAPQIGFPLPVALHPAQRHQTETQFHGFRLPDICRSAGTTPTRPHHVLQIPPPPGRGM